MITVLGATGLIGSHLAARLAASGADHLALSRGEDWTGRNLGHVIYCIGMTADFRSRPFETVDAHVCTLREVLRDCSFESLLYLSSARVYAGGEEPAAEDSVLRVAPADPDQLYNISKAMGESLALGCGKNTRVARISNVFGRDFKSRNFLATIIRDAVTDGSITLRSSRESSKDYVDIDDVAEALIKIAVHGAHRIYNVAGGSNVSNGELVGRIQELTGCRVEVAAGAPTIRFPRIDIGRMQSEFAFQPSSVLGRIGGLVEAYRAYYGDRDDTDRS